jgi:hypothetical protein
MRITFRQDDVIIAFTIGKTSNKKIANDKDKIVQTYSYSVGQFNEAIKPQTTMRDFFAQDKSVCGDCPFAVNNGAKLQACYTHKFTQYVGFLGQIRSIAKEFGSFEAIPTLTSKILYNILKNASGKYVRFGTYGEPSLIPFDVMELICDVAKSWTGYTHQWAKKPEYSKYLMASTHNLKQVELAMNLGFLSFTASPIPIPSLVSCPASKESGFKSNCSKCGLCSGTEGKGDKSVVILEH